MLTQITPHMAPTAILNNISNNKFTLKENSPFKIENKKNETIVYKTPIIIPFISPFVLFDFKLVKQPKNILSVFIIWFTTLIPVSVKSKNLKEKAKSKIPIREKQIANNNPLKIEI